MWKIIADPTLLNPDLLWQKFTKLHYYSNCIIYTLHWAQQSKPIVVCVCVCVCVFVLNEYIIFGCYDDQTSGRTGFEHDPWKLTGQHSRRSPYSGPPFSHLCPSCFFPHSVLVWWCEILNTIMVTKACCCCPAGLERNSLGNEVSC